MNGVIILVLAIYMLVWIYQVHKEMRDYTGGHYPISPGKALGFCFIPLYSIYWMCYVSYKLAKELEAYLGAGAIRPKRVLLFSVLSVVPGMFISGLGSVFDAIVLLWIQRGLNDLWKGVRAAGPNAQAVAGLNAMVAS